MKQKYLNQSLGFSIDLNDGKKWQSTKQGTLKLVNPNDTDKLFTVGYLKVVNKDAAASGNEKPNGKVYISGMANANVVDRVKERVDPRGLDSTDFLKNPILLAHHSYYHPIGQVTRLEQTNEGVEFEAWVGDPTKADLTEMQEEVRSLVKQGILKTVSIGFIPKEIQRPTYNDEGSMIEPLIILKWELLELSIVGVPCNQDSTFSVVDNGKNHTEGENKNTTNKGIDEMSDKKTSEDNAVKTVLDEIKTILSGLSTDMKTVSESTQSLLKKMDEKAKKPSDGEPDEDDAAKRLSVLETKFADVSKVIAMVWDKLSK